MKASTLILTLLSATLSLSAWAQNGPSGQIAFTPQTYDFGTIKEVDGPVTCTVTYRNTSDRPYVINFVSAGCGCTTPVYDKAPLMPGKEARMKITFDPKDRPGYFRKEVYLVSNDRRSTDIVTITGTVEGRPHKVTDDYPVVFTPSPLRGESNSVWFGNIPVGYRHTKAVGLYNPTDRPLHITVEASSDGRLSVSAPSAVPAKGRGQLLVTYDLKSDPVYAPFTVRMTLKVDGATVATIKGEGVSTPDFTSLTADQRISVPRADLSSRFRYFGDITAGSKNSHRFTITNGGSRRLDIVGLSCSSSQTSCRLDRKSLEPGQSAFADVTVTPAGKGRLSESVTLVTNDPTDPVLKLRLTGNVK